MVWHGMALHVALCTALRGVAWHCKHNIAWLRGLLRRSNPGQAGGEGGARTGRGAGEGQDVLEDEEELPAALFVLEQLQLMVWAWPMQLGLQQQSQQQQQQLPPLPLS